MNTIGRTTILGLTLCTAAALCGCSITREKTIINTPAVYSVTKDASGALQTNLVSAASVSSTVKKERTWLPQGYALRLEQDVWGVNVTPYDPTSQSAKVQCGVIATRATWTPTATNQMYAPPITAQAKVNNKAIPFFMSAGAQFTSGNTRGEQSDTNANATALVPGVPADQK